MYQPVRHRSQVAEPSLEVYASPIAVLHCSQRVLPFFGAYFAGSQSSQAAAPDLEDEPAGQLIHVVPFAADFVPAAHVSQLTLWLVAATVPLAQLLQARPPAEYFPGSQSSHAAAPDGAHVPGAQLPHATAPLAATCRPASHSLHVSRPFVSA